MLCIYCIVTVPACGYPGFVLMCLKCTCHNHIIICHTSIHLFGIKPSDTHELHCHTFQCFVCVSNRQSCTEINDVNRNFQHHRKPHVYVGKTFKYRFTIRAVKESSPLKSQFFYHLLISMPLHICKIIFLR